MRKGKKVQPPLSFFEEAGVAHFGCTLVASEQFDLTIRFIESHLETKKRFIESQHNKTTHVPHINRSV
jgi:hypothetical protein